MFFGVTEIWDLVTLVFSRYSVVSTVIPDVCGSTVAVAQDLPSSVSESAIHCLVRPLSRLLYLHRTTHTEDTIHINQYLK